MKHYKSLKIRIAFLAFDNIIGKLSLLICLLIVLSVDLKGQDLNFEWVKQLGGTGTVHGRGIVADEFGNTYTTGNFSGIVDFDPGPDTLSLSSTGILEDIFIQKLDAEGNFVWVKQIGGGNIDVGRAIELDNLGNIYTTGSFHGNVDFDPGPDTFYLTATDNQEEIYIQKLDPQGNFVWAVQLIGGTEDFGLDVKTDSNGNVYVTGIFEGTIDFDPGPDVVNITADSISPGSYQGNDSFLLKLDPNGNFIWVKHLHGIFDIRSSSLAIDAQDNVYIAGSFEISVSIDVTPNYTLTLDSEGASDVFICKYLTDGSLDWAKRFGGSGFDRVTSITTDSGGNVYTTGYFYETADFHPNPNVTLNIASAGERDVFIHKIDSAGVFDWVKTFGGTSQDTGYSIAIDQNDNIYTTGFFSGSVDFDPGTASFNLNAIGYYDSYISRLDPNGNFIWAGGFGEDIYDTGLSITIDNSNNIYSTGYFNGTVDFDPGIGVSEFTSIGWEDCFIHKMSLCTIEAIDPDVHVACNSFEWIDGITYTQSNSSATFSYLTPSGCDSIVSLDLTIHNVSDTTLTLNGPTVIANNNYASFQWLDCNDSFNPVSGETTQSFTALASGAYAVEIEESGCIDTSACVTFSIFVSTESIQQDLVKVSPNPSLGQFQIQLDKTYSDVSAKLFDINGKIVHSVNFQNTDLLTFDLNIPAGLYFLNASSQQGNYTSTIVIK